MFFTKWFKKAKTELRTITSDSFGGFFDLFTTTSKGMELVPVYSCIRIISQTIALSPLKHYEKTDSGRKELYTAPLMALFKNPFGSMTYYNWMNMLATGMVARGNSYALIVRDGRFNVTELIPLTYLEVDLMEDINSFAFYYQINVNERTYNVSPYEILHFKAFTEDGKTGLNPLELHRKTTASATNEAAFNENFYKQAINISGVIETAGKLDANAVDEIRKQFNDKYSGVSNSGKTAVLSNGKTYKQLRLLNPVDANYIEGAKLTRSDIGVIFGVPLNKLGDLSQATYSNITEMNRDFYKSTIAPYFAAIEQEIALKLLPESRQLTHYFEFYADTLLSASKKERYEVHAIAVRNGIMTRNEVREYENLERIEGLDEILQESGVLTIEQANKNFNRSTNEKEILNEKTGVEDE